MNRVEKYELIIKSQAGVLYLEGAPGTGKTAIAKQIAEKNGWNYVQFILSQVDSSDIAGIPHKKTVNGITLTIRTVPEWAYKANNSNKPTLVNFDELNRAPIENRNAALQILNERQVGDCKLNDNIYFIATGNIGDDGSRSDGTEVDEMDSAMWGRLVYMNHEQYFPEWKEAYGKEHVWDEILQYLENVPEHLNKSFQENCRVNANPRTWTNLSNFITRTTDDYDERIVLAKEFAKSYIGPQIAGDFNRYLEEKQLININSVLDEWDRVKPTVEKFDRSRISRLIHEFNTKKKLHNLSDTQMRNLFDFLKCVHDDERANLIFQIIFKSVTFTIEFTTDNILFIEMKRIYNLLRENNYDGSKIKKFNVEKKYHNYFKLFIVFYQDILEYMKVYVKNSNIVNVDEEKDG